MPTHSRRSKKPRKIAYDTRRTRVRLIQLPAMALGLALLKRRGEGSK